MLMLLQLLLLYNTSRSHYNLERSLIWTALCPGHGAFLWRCCHAFATGSMNYVCKKGSVRGQPYSLFIFFLILILEQHMYLKFWLCHDTITVKGARGKVWFDSLNIKYVSKRSCYTSAEAYLSHRNSKMTNALFNFLSDKYASGEASLDNFEAYLSFCESNNTSPRAPFTVINKVDNS
jgi:hypothetical protein